MDCVIVPTKLVNSQKRRYNGLRSEYKIDLWLEVKKRWLLLGVLCSVLLAVVAPRVGAPGGNYCMFTIIDHSRTHCTPFGHWYVWYAAGARARPPRALAARACVVAASHAHVAAPALSAVVISAFRDSRLDSRIVKGALLSSVGPPCAWLSLCVASDAGTAVMFLVVNYCVSLVASPVALFFLCGRAPIPALGPTISSALYILPPFLIGLLHTYVKSFRKCKPNKQKFNYPTTYNAEQSTQKAYDMQNTQFANNNTQIAEDVHSCAQCVCNCTQPAQCMGNCTQPARCMCLTRLAGLVLLYVDCCDRLKESEGSLQVADVLGTFVLTVGYVCLNAVFCRVYTYCGFDPDTVRTLAICSVPKALHTGWESSTSCVPAGLARLPSVFLSPAQALLLAAISDCPCQPEGKKRNEEDWERLPH